MLDPKSMNAGKFPVVIAFKFNCVTAGELAIP
jgi:hypothetical protein